MKLKLLALCVFAVFTAMFMFIVLSENTVDISVEKGSYQFDDELKINIEKDSYQFGDSEISYILANDTGDLIDCSSYGDLERKTGGGWEAVPSTKPDALAWCGTMSSVDLGKSEHVLPFLAYNGTLADGTYRIRFDYTVRDGRKAYTIYSSEFALKGDIPMTEGYAPPADVRLELDAGTLAKNPSVIEYSIINESGGDVFISPEVTLMLYQNSEWRCVIYLTGQEGEIVSAERENYRSIHTDLIGGLENCTKIRIIEQVAIPMRNLFYIFYEIEF